VTRRRPASRVALDVRGLLGVNELFRVAGGTRSDPAVALWFAERPGPLGMIAQQWFGSIRRCGQDVLELLHDGCPVASVADAPFAYVNVFSSHVNVGFFQGAGLPDPAGLLLGKGKHMRHVKLRPLAPTDEAAVQHLIRSAYLDIQTRLRE
jgi:hypothetical protein